MRKDGKNSNIMKSSVKDNRESNMKNNIVNNIRNNIWSNKCWIVLAGCFMAVCMLTGCGAFRDRKYTDDQLQNLAKLEVYEAGTDTLLKTIEDEETLYQYLSAQVFSANWVDELDFDEDEDVENFMKKENELKKIAKDTEETYYIVEYKYPVAKFNDRKLKKILTITLYQDTNIAKMTAAEESVKNMYVPEEFLAFYYEMSEEESEFYASLLAE